MGRSKNGEERPGIRKTASMTNGFLSKDDHHLESLRISEEKLKKNEDSDSPGEDSSSEKTNSSLENGDLLIPKEALSTPLKLKKHKRTASLEPFLIKEITQFQEKPSPLASPGTSKMRTSYLNEAPILKLPPILLARILKYLPYREQFRSRQVCKTWLKIFMIRPELSTVIDLSSTNKMIEDLAIISIAKVCGPNIEYLCLRGCWNVTDAGFIELISVSQELKIVDLNSCWDLTDRSLSEIRRCNKIQKLDLSNCRKISDATMSEVLPSNQEITELKVSYCKNLTNTTMINIGDNLRNIQALYLQRCTSIGDAGFMFLRNPEKALNNLSILSLSDCSFLSDDTILSISKGCPNLRVLNLSFCCALSSDALEHLANGCKKLICLDLSFCGNAVYNEGLLLLSKNLTELERLSFRSCIMVTDEGIQSLMENAKKLKYLNPSSCQNVSKQILTQIPPQWKILSGNVPLQDIEPSVHFPKTGADIKFPPPKFS